MKNVSIAVRFRTGLRWRFAAATAIIGVALLVSSGLPGQDLKPIWVISFRDLGPRPENTETLRPNALPERVGQLLEGASAVVIPAADLSDFQPLQIEPLRSFVQRPGGPAVFTIGERLAPGFLEQRLGIDRGVRIDAKPDDGRWPIVAQGLYSQEENVIEGIEFHATARFSMNESLQHVKDFMISLLTREKEPMPAMWRPKPGQTNVYFCHPHGKFQQELKPHYLAGNASPHDSWYVKVINTSIPGLQLGWSHCENGANRFSCELASAQSMPSYGPNSSVGPSSSAVVTMTSTGGPPVTWRWHTGSTQVHDKTGANTRIAEWDVDYIAHGADARKAHTWKPGAAAKNGRQQSFTVICHNSLSWLDPAQGVVPCRLPDWQLTVAP